jgi:putative hydrolase of the HAD superfamily
MNGIGFDLGNTLIDYKDIPLSWQSLYRNALRDMAANCRYLASEEAIATGEAILAKYNTRLNPRTVEVSSRCILGAILAAWGLDITERLETAAEAFFSFFQRHAVPYADMVSTLAYLKGKGFRIGVLTDVPYGMDRRFVERDLLLCGVRDYIDVLLTSADVGYRKPDCHGYLELARRLGVAPHAMAYVGDEPKDVQGANGVGMISVFIDRSGCYRTFGETHRITALEQLAGLKCTALAEKPNSA